MVWGATVELRKEGGNTALYGALTGVDGKFAFPSVAAGRYQLVATSPGYVPAEYGQKRMKGAGLPLVVTAGQAMPNLRMEMVPTGAISGRVTDPYGQPIAIADVFVLKSSYQEGQRILTQFLSAKTDERGEFRLFWLTPGTYYLNVVVPEALESGGSDHECRKYQSCNVDDRSSYDPARCAEPADRHRSRRKRIARSGLLSVDDESSAGATH